MKNLNLLIDFDSTFIKDESLELISQISIKNSKEKLEAIKKITNRAMEGEISFDQALNQRIKLLNANKTHIKIVIEKIKKNISTSFLENKNYFKKNNEKCFIVSGGFKEIIYPIVKPFGFKKSNIYANEFIYDNENIISINKNNPLSKDLGKVKIANMIKGKNIIIGDGYTDFEIKKHNKAILFIQYIENINRKKLNDKADFVAKDFNQILTFINEKF